MARLNSLSSPTCVWSTAFRVLNILLTVKLGASGCTISKGLRPLRQERSATSDFAFKSTTTQRAHRKAGPLGLHDVQRLQSSAPGPLRPRDVPVVVAVGVRQRRNLVPVRRVDVDDLQK